MFYDTNQVKNVLICKNCESNMDLPKSLPCGEVMCSHCESNIQMNGNKFDCSLCQNKHDMPRDGLPICKPLLQILSIGLILFALNKDLINMGPWEPLVCVLLLLKLLE